MRKIVTIVFCVQPKTQLSDGQPLRMVEVSKINAFF